MRRSRQGIYRPQHPDKYLGNAANIIYRSSWEFRFFRYCDLTPGVIKWASEEFHVAYVSPVDGQFHRYFPDVYVQVKAADGSLKHWVVEIKPKHQTMPPKVPKRRSSRYLSEAATYAVNQAKWNACDQYCKTRGWQFLLLTEDHLFDRGTR